MIYTLLQIRKLILGTALDLKAVAIFIRKFDLSETSIAAKLRDLDYSLIDFMLKGLSFLQIWIKLFIITADKSRDFVSQARIFSGQVRQNISTDCFAVYAVLT